MKKSINKPVGGEIVEKNKSKVKIKPNIHYLVISPDSIFNGQIIISKKQFVPYSSITCRHYLYLIEEDFFITEQFINGNIVVLPINDKYEYVKNELGMSSNDSEESSHL